ncbi:autotransporter domain-containing protein [Phascolarctobacterium succinatutens]|uniref:autotransporter domain-containing protein n=1 Tax=Phascolarctobacterium succinatutens TaxID=626940 RepID=UPI00307967DC
MLLEPYVYNNVDSSGKMGTLHLYQSNTLENPYDKVTGFVAAGGKVVVNSNLDITATSDYASAGITAENNANLIIYGNVKMRKDNAENPWGIITDNVHGNIGPGGATSMDKGYDAKYTGARWNPTGISVTGSQADITVNGDVDIAVRGTAIKTDSYNSVNGVNPHDLATISLLGKYTRIDTPYREENFVEGFGKFIEPYYALASYGGTINVNVKNQEAQNGNVEIVGNVLAMKTSAYTHANYLYQDGRINLGLTTSDSYWKGIIDNTNLNRDVEDKTSLSGYKYNPTATPVNADHSGEVNLWLQNGAQWIYENASRNDGLDYSNMPQFSQPSYGNYDGMSHLSRLVGGKDSASAGIIRVNDSDPIQIAEAEGVTKIWYEHADATPGTIIGGDVKVLNAKTGTEMMLYTGNNGISKGFAEGDTAAEKNNVSEVLNSLAHKLWYMAGDSNLTGSVSIAEGLTASSVTMKTGNITFAEGGQGFYDYTPEKDDKTYATGPIVKSENIGETRESDINGVVSVNVTEAQDGVSGSAPSAMYAAGEAEGPLVVDLQGHTLKLNANNQTANYVSTVYVDENKSMEIKDSKGNGVLKVSAGLGADGNADTKAKYVYGIRVGEGGNLTANTDVEIDGVKSSATQRAYGVYVSTKGNVVFEKDLSIKNVQTGNKVGPNTAGIYADSSSSADAPINITVKGNLNIENVLGSAIRALNTSTVSTAGATIKAADMSNGTDYSQYYALQANKGTINLNTGEGITAGILDVTGDMKVTDNKASVINVNMTKGSQWTGAVSNIPGSTYNAPAGQFNLTMAEGSVWNHETGRSVDTLKTTFAGSNVSKLDGSGVIYQNSDKGITVYNYKGDTTVVYGHDAENPLNITGGNFTVKTAAAGSKITLVTDSQGINADFEAADTAAEKNNVKEVLNKLANKLFYTGYKDANLAGVVKIADGLTASSVSAIVKASGDITFSDGSNGTKKAGQGFYDYTPEEDKPDYKTGAITKSENISLNREVDEKGVAHINVTESNASDRFASALYAGEETSPSKPMTVNLSGKGLALNAAQTNGQATAIYAGTNTYIKVINPSADQKLTITANNTDTRGSHGIYADENAHLNISGSVEITDITTKGDSATGINIQGKQSEINIDGPLTITNVKGIRENGAGMNAAGILVTGDTSSVTVTGPVDISGVRGSGIRLRGANTKVSVGGGTITAAEDSDKSHNFYAVRVDKGTLDINMNDGAAGDTTTKITGDMYATGQYGKKVVEYSGGELIDWKDAGILNVALTDKDSFWKGVAAYDQYNDDYGSGGNTAHDIGQFNLYLQNGATWTNEQQSHVTTTTIASKNPVWAGSTLATLHGGKDAANAGLIYQKDNNPISVVNYSGHTTVFYEHDAADPTKIIGGNFNITNAAEGSAITFITDNKGITSGFADGDSAEAKDNVAHVLNSMSGKLFYKNYTDGHLAGVVKIAEGLTASSAELKTGDISFSTDATGTKNPGQGYYDYKPSGEKPEYNTGAIKNSENISKTRELDANGIAKVEVTEPNILEGYSKFAAALYADDPTASMTVNMSGKDLALSSVVEAGAQAAGIYVDRGANITIDNPFVKQKLAITATNNDTRGAYGIFAKGDNAKLNISGPVEITNITTKGAAVGGIVVRGQNTDVVIDGPLAISNVKAESDGAMGYNGYGIGVTGVGSTVTVNGTVDISGIHGSAILLKESGNKVSVGGGNIAAAVDSDKSHNYYAARVEKGTLDINMQDGVAGDATTKITGDMYIDCLHGMKPPSLGSEELVEYKEEGVLNVALTNADSYWKGVAAHEKYKTDKHQYGYDMHDVGDLNLYLQNGATWTNEQQSHVTTTTMADKNPIWDGSTLASLHGGKDAAHAGHIFQNDSKNITINNYSGNTNIYYAHEGNGEAADNYKAGDTIIKSAAAGSAVYLITDNTNVAMGNDESVANVLNALAGKLTYSNFATEKNLKGVVKISSGLTASGAELKKGDISFSTETTGTRKPGQGYYEYDEAAENTFTDKITGGNDKKYVEAGIEKEKGVYTFTKDATIKVTKGLSELGAIESSGGPITINAEGKALDVSYTVPKGDNVARAVATSNSFGKSKDITIKADSLKLSADTTGFRAQGIYAVGGKITIDANTTIATSAQNDSNGIYAGNGGIVTVNGDLDIKEDTKVSKYYALNADDTGVINVNIKDGKAGAGTVKLKGDIHTKSAESYDDWENETTTSSSTVNLALQGKDSSWTGRSLYEAVSSGDDKTSYGSFNLWLTDGATWTNEKTGKTIPEGFAGSHVTNFVGGADENHAGNIFQNDSKNLTIDKYSGNTNIYYAHTGNGEAADNYKAGDTIIKSAAAGSAVSLITDNKGVAMDNKDSVANVLNALAGKLTYSNFATGEKNLTGVVKIADGLTASSKAMQTGDISFSSKDGKGSLKDGSIAPGLTYPDTQTPESSKLNSGITGDAKADYQYKKDGILKEDGSYVFTQDPTVIEVKEGAAVNATAKDIVIDTTKAKLELKGETGINAENGNVTLNGSTVISGTDAAINAGENANVNVNGNNSALTINGSINANGGNITVDSGNASSTITGDINAANGGSVVISLIEKNSVLNGGYNVDGNSSIALSLANGATWNLTDGEEAAGMSLLRMANGTAAAGLTISGGKTEAETGYLNMTKRSKALQIADYSGWETIIYNHDNKGSEAQEFKSGNTVISNAKEGSGVILFTDSNNININSQAEVEAVLKVLAEKVQYTDHAANGANLKGKVRIAEGLTSAGKTGVMKWDETSGIGKFDPSSIKWGEIYNGDYETLVMKGVRSAATTSMHSWRDNMQDTYTGADLADADGIFAKALGGKTSSDVKGVKDDNTYRGVQVGYDKALANGWHAGVAFDYRNGDSNYLLGGKGDNQLYSFGVYGVKNFEDQSYLRIAAKAGRVENEYDVYNEIRTLKLHGDYKANAYGLTMEYGKIFGTEASYFTPKAQLTWSQVGSKDYTAHTPNDSMRIDQDAYSSLVARFGVEAGAKSEKGRVYVGLYGAHEFNGDISASYFAKDGGYKHTSFDGSDTWMEMSIGGSYDLSDNCHIYADFAKDFGGDFERKWKASAGLRFEF